MSPAHCDGELTTCPGCACEQSVLPRDLSGPKEEGQSVLLQGEQPQLLLIPPPPRRPTRLWIPLPCPDSPVCLQVHLRSRCPGLGSLGLSWLSVTLAKNPHGQGKVRPQRVSPAP